MDMNSGLGLSLATTSGIIGGGGGSGGGAGAPGGPSTSIQYNSGGSFAGSSSFTFNGSATAPVLTLDGSTSSRFNITSSGGFGPPTLGAHSIGERILLFDGTGAGGSDHAIGIESGNTWFSIDAPGSGAPSGWKFYAGATNFATLATHSAYVAWIINNNAATGLPAFAKDAYYQLWADSSHSAIVSFQGTGKGFVEFGTGIKLSAPSGSAHCDGSRIVLYSGGGASDHAIGLEGNGMWFGVPSSTNVNQFRWYGNTTQRMMLQGDGTLTVGTGLIFAEPTRQTNLYGVSTGRSAIYGGQGLSGIALRINPVATATVNTDITTAVVIDPTYDDTVGVYAHRALSLPSGGNFICSGVDSVSPNNPAYGLAGGVMMYWYSKKAAFRAGSDNGTRFTSDGNIGNYSAAFGKSMAAGTCSFAAGDTADATGTNSIALGQSCAASGQASVALGQQANASGQGAISGSACSASGSWDLALGYSCAASGGNSVCIGNTSTSVQRCVAIGESCAASAIASYAIGFGCNASGVPSYAGGISTVASAANAVALGQSFTNSTASSVALGNNTAVLLIDSSGIAHYSISGTDKVTIDTVGRVTAAVHNTPVVALTDAPTIAIDGTTSNIYKVTLGGNRTLGAPSGTPIDGAMFTLRVTQDATGSRTLAYNAAYAFSADVPSPTLSTGANKVDYLIFRYNSTTTKWECLAVNRGFN